MSASPIAETHSSANAATLERVAHCLAGRRFEELRQLVTPGIRLRALIPPGPEERNGAEAVVQRLQEWFGWCDSIRVESVVAQPIVDRWLLAYRFEVGDGAPRQFIAQQCICDVEDGRVSAIDLVCSGFRAAPAQVADGVHRFDAGDLSCVDGLAQEFRRQITAIPVGAVLEVVTSDPAAREDLPPLARLMGNTVHGTHVLDDGRVAITVERNR